VSGLLFSPKEFTLAALLLLSSWRLRACSQTGQVQVLHHSTSEVTLNFVPQLQFTLVFIHSAQVLIFDCGYPKLVAGMLVVHSVIFFVLFFDFYQRTYLGTRRAQKKLQ